jgi:hypothetical protein
MNMKMILAAALLAVSACGPSAEDHPAGATPYTGEEKAAISRGAVAVERQSNEARADAVVACGLALLEAEERGLVSSDAQVPPPWEVTTAATNGGQRVSCKGLDRQGDLTVVVDLLCTDVNDDKCHPLVRIDRP